MNMDTFALQMAMANFPLKLKLKTIRHRRTKKRDVIIEMAASEPYPNNVSTRIRSTKQNSFNRKLCTWSSHPH